MGRAKVEIKLREDFRARCTTYMTRMKGLRKKAVELHLLCGVDVLVASSSPKLNTVEFWPAKDTPEFHRIRERYLYFRKKQQSDNSGTAEENGKPSMLSPPFPVPSLFYEEMASMEIKLKEVRERLLFLNAPSSSTHTLPPPTSLTPPTSLLPSNPSYLDDFKWADSLLV